MKSSIIKNIRSTIIIALMQTIMFTFLSVLVYGLFISYIFYFIIMFNLLSLIFVGFLEYKRQIKIKESLVRFEENMDYKNLDALVSLIGDDYKEILEDILADKKSTDLEFEKQRQNLLDYEDLIELWTHEIKTPISVIDLTLQNHIDEINETTYNRLQLSNREIKNYVDNILYLARLKSDKKDYKLERLNLKDVLYEAINRYYPIIAEKGYIITENIEDVFVISDFYSLSFIISQLISNAVKYTSDKIKIETNMNGNVGLIIRNNGQKIYDKDVPFIFEKGYTGKSTQNINSTGMGLYLAKSYADDLGISINILNNDNTDVAFELVFTKDR